MGSELDHTTEKVHRLRNNASGASSIMHSSSMQKGVGTAGIDSIEDKDGNLKAPGSQFNKNATTTRRRNPNRRKIQQTAQPGNSGEGGDADAADRGKKESGMDRDGEIQK